MRIGNALNWKLLAAFAAGMLIVPCGLLLLALGGFLPSRAVEEPPGWETSLGQRALDASLQRRARGLVNPVRPDDHQALLSGISIYRTNCSGCHGGSRDRSNWGTKNFYPRIPQLGIDLVELTPEQAFVAVRDGVRYSGMGAWQGMLSEREMWEVANFVSRAHRLPPAVDHQWRNPKPTPGH